MKTIFFLILLFALSANALVSTPNNASHLILNGATATGVGANTVFAGPYGTFQCYGTTTAGAGASVITIEVSNVVDPATGTSVDWVTAGTITLTLATTQSTDGFAVQSSWRWARAKVTSISGTGASVSCFMGKPK